MKVSYLVFAVCDMSDVRGLQYLLELNNMMHYKQKLSNKLYTFIQARLLFPKILITNFVLLEKRFVHHSYCYPDLTELLTSGQKLSKHGLSLSPGLGTQTSYKNI